MYVISVIRRSCAITYLVADMYHLVVVIVIAHSSCLSVCFFFSSRRRHTRLQGDWSSDVCSSDLHGVPRCDSRRQGVRAGGDRSSVPRGGPGRGHSGRARRGARSCARLPNRRRAPVDRKSTRLNSSHPVISYSAFCLTKKKKIRHS